MAKRKKPVGQLVPATRSRGNTAAPDQLLDDVRALIRRTREGVALAINAATAPFYESTDSARQQLESLRGDPILPDLIFRSPHVLDFLGLTNPYSEKDL